MAFISATSNSPLAFAKEKFRRGYLLLEYDALQIVMRRVYRRDEGSTLPRKKRYPFIKLNLTLHKTVNHSSRC